MSNESYTQTSDSKIEITHKDILEGKTFTNKQLIDCVVRLMEQVELLEECVDYYSWTTPCELEESDKIQLSEVPNVWTNGKRAREAKKKLGELRGEG